MVRDSLAQALELPYSVFESGPYPPPCQAERVAYCASLGLTDCPPPDPQIANILTSLSRVFNTSSVLLTLCSEQRVWIRNAIGFAAGEFAWRWAFCGWSLAPPSPQVLVIEDTLKDARFRDNVVVQGEPRIRYFVGAPLVASNGHRLGTLCYLGPEPRVTTAEEAMILANMAELVVRELEKGAVKSAQQRAEADSGVAEPLTRYMMRSVACFQRQSVAFVDTQPRSWQALHCNLAFTDETEIDYSTAVASPFWDLFQLPFDMDSEAWHATLDVVARAGEFAVRDCRLRSASHHGTFTITFRPADRTALDEDMQIIGVPSDVPSEMDASGRYYFAFVVANDTSSTRTSSLNASTDNLPQVQQSLQMLEHQKLQRQTPIPGLELGAVVGKGSFGTVFRGRYKGQNVAVKVCTGALQLGRGRANKPWSNVEAAMAQRLNHPAVVRTFKHTAVLMQEGRVMRKSFGDHSGSLGSGTDWSDGWFDDEDDPMCQEAEAHNPVVEMETWAVMEFCNRGTLQAGVDKGYFRQDRACKPPSPPNVAAVLATALQLASALTYLHDQDVIHGDLAGGNILLTSDDSQPHGLSCKVADFGLSRELNFQTRLMTASYGTVTHMPPELLTEGKLSKAADVYAFGVLIWEMTTGVRAWAGMSHTQILAAVAMEGKQLCFLPDCNPSLVELARRCMARNPESRPTFPQIQDRLEQLDRELQAAAHHM